MAESTNTPTISKSIDSEVLKDEGVSMVTPTAVGYLPSLGVAVVVQNVH
jgi:hypothetical protein